MTSKSKPIGNRKRRFYLATSAAILCAFAAAMVAGAESRGPEKQGESDTRVAFPDDYRNWTRVKSMVILDGHEHYDAFGGFHHVYANDKAIVALKNRKPFSKGSVLVFELLEERLESNAISEGPRKVIGVMEKDPDRFANTEGWGFEDFPNANPRERSVTDMRTQCLSCHQTRATSDFVYSRYRE